MKITHHIALTLVVASLIGGGCGKSTQAPAAPAPSAAPATASGPDAAAEAPETPAAADDHAGHDHAGHDHAGHDHAGHDHAPPAPTTPAAAPSKDELGGFDSPREAALAGLKAYQAQSVPDLFAAYPPTGMVHTDIPKEQVFKAGDWTVTSAAAWGGDLVTLRIDGQDGRVTYARDGDTLLAAGVFLRNGRWYFRKLFKMTRTEWEGWGKVASTTSARVSAPLLRPQVMGTKRTPACVAKCIEQNQMRAVSPQMIEADCTKLCAGQPQPTPSVTP